MSVKEVKTPLDFIEKYGSSSIPIVLTKNSAPNLIHSLDYKDLESIVEKLLERDNNGVTR